MKVLVAQLCLTVCDLMDCSHQALLSMGFLGEEYWNRLSFPFLGDLPDSGIKPTSLGSNPWIEEPGRLQSMVSQRVRDE